MAENNKPNHSPDFLSGASLPSNYSGFNLPISTSMPDGIKGHWIEEKDLEDIVKNNTLSLDKSLCVASIGYLLGQLEKIYEFFFTAQQIEGVDKFLILFVGIAAATAIITGLQWYKGEDKLDEIITRIKSRTVVLNHNENDSEKEKAI